MTTSPSDQIVARPDPAPAFTIPNPPGESSPYEELAAWYSGFSYAEHYRKVVIALCREVVRGEYAARNEKVTESRLDDLARLHDAYIDYLAVHLNGRKAWEKAFLAQGGMR